MSDTDSTPDRPDRPPTSLSLDRLREHTHGPYRRFNNDTASVMRDLYSRGMTYAEIAEEYNTAASTVMRVVNKTGAYNDEKE
jgi:DNA invertase Pin-like site-specific DNA recombinase